MDYWPKLVLTDYEKTRVAEYENNGLPSVKRRTYTALLNAVADPNVFALKQVRTVGSVQITRRARVFALSFAGDCANWRLGISKANGDLYTARNPLLQDEPSTFPELNNSSDPIVAAMCPGSIFSPVAHIGAALPLASWETGEGSISFSNASDVRFPLILDPNWVLENNETLFFKGTPIVDGQQILEICVHVWEFAGEWSC